MITVDSSIAIAAFSPWHHNHERADQVLEEQPRLVGHAAVETYSVLTRLPPPYRSPTDVVGRFLRSAFPDDLLVLTAEEHRQFVATLDGCLLRGGAVYDALIAYTALQHSAELVSADARASRTYEAMGVRVRSLL